MKPSKIRNRTMHHPSLALRSRLMSSHLSKDLRKTHGIRSIRVVAGDSVTILRGTYRNTSGRIDKVNPVRGIVVGGMKEEKPAGEKYDVYVNPSNLLVTSLNLDDKWRAAKIKGESRKKAPAKIKEDDE